MDWSKFSHMKKFGLATKFHNEVFCERFRN